MTGLEKRTGQQGISRRRLILGTLAAGLAAGLGRRVQARARRDDRPNILSIVIDDLNDWVGYLGGYPGVHTPNLDSLAARSTAFIRAYCNVPLCNPSRASAWSGLSPQQTGVFDNIVSLKSTNPSAVLLPEFQAESGYEVANIGKVYHLYEKLPVPLPPEVPAANQQCSGYPRGNPAGLFDWAPLDVDDSAMPDYVNTQAAIEFLGASHQKPFMLNLGIVQPHLAWYVPRRYFDLYPLDEVHVPYVPDRELEDLPPAGRHVANYYSGFNCIVRQDLWKNAIQGYLASISFADAQVGRIIAALDASPHADNTAVILWSDNAYHMGEKFHFNKETLWERSTHIPFLIRLPGQARGTRVEAPVSLLDMMPTVLELCDQPPPYPMAGRSLMPLLKDPSLSWEHPVLMTIAKLAENGRAGDRFDYAVRTRDWRYIRYFNGDRELYNENEDPGEHRNRANDGDLAPLMEKLGSCMPPLREPSRTSRATFNAPRARTSKRA